MLVWSAPAKLPGVAMINQLFQCSTYLIAQRIFNETNVVTMQSSWHKLSGINGIYFQSLELKASRNVVNETQHALVVILMFWFEFHHVLERFASCSHSL